ncbi:hypothetical protein EPI10_007041 [Gossypium australe]|uniref:Uncharacterized protein n=1 Tax=Gossypium australe TaxID=47621 RepID=A0A5B6WU14_9ROSI|nr:hypothetical protein EPI10_007041 [Gossypium australe]
MRGILVGFVTLALVTPSLYVALGLEARLPAHFLTLQNKNKRDELESSVLTYSNTTCWFSRQPSSLCSMERYLLVQSLLMSPWLDLWHFIATCIVSIESS